MSNTFICFTFAGKCYVVPKELISEEPFVWTQKGTHRFYYEKMYNVHGKEFSRLPENYREIHGCSLYNSGNLVFDIEPTNN